MLSLIRTAALAAALPSLLLAQAGPPQTVTSAAGQIRIEKLAALEFPWAVAPLPDGRLLVTEKPGRLRIFQNGKLSEPLTGVPKTSYRERKQEQGGLLDVIADPNFAQNRRIYFSFTEFADKQPPGLKETDDKRFGGFLDLNDNLLAGGAVARATLDGNALKDVQVIWRQDPKTIGRGHFAMRMAFAPDGSLLVTSGDRMRFDPAQDPKATLGKVMRISSDGNAEIFSSGHRNILAIAVQPSGQVWGLEMGPLGGDELNLVERGGNYGWPVVSEGVNYDKSAIPNHQTRPEFKAPVKVWTPVISPSGAMFYDGSLFPWKGDLIAGGLSSQAIIRLTLDGRTVKNEERINMGRRIRDVAQASDGAILVVTDDKSGELLRLTPAAAKTR
ncbi:MAG TPA: PQQ-dependent sugar dehydrogenase [Vicinamibacterales bacterium]